MTAIGLVLPRSRARLAVWPYRLGRPLLSARLARSIRRYAVAYSALQMLLGWPLSGGVYDDRYFWLAIGGYLVATVTVQLLSVLPTFRRISQ